jgi:hypothetical protein
MALPPIVAKITAETSGLTKGLADANTRLSTFAKVGGAATAAVTVGLVALTKASLENIDALAKQARSLGLTTAAFQKMSLVANEAGVETGKLSSMLGLMQRNIVELQSGTAKQVETFRALGLSISELQGLTPDEQFAKIAESLDGITDPATKTALAMEVFGRSGREAINMLSGYSDAAANAAEFQQRFGIAVSQVDSDRIEAANDALGRVQMVLGAIGTQLAVALSPAIEAAAIKLLDLAQGFNDLIENLNPVNDMFGNVKGRAEEFLGVDLYSKLITDAQAFEASKGTIVNYREAITDAKFKSADAVAEFDNLSDTLFEIGETDAAAEIGDLAGQLVYAESQFNNGKITAEEFREELQRVMSKATDLVAELEKIDGLNTSNAVSAIDAVSSALERAMGFAASLRALLPGGTGGADDGLGMTEGTPLSGDVSGLMPPSVEGVTSSPRPRGAPALLGEPEGTGGRRGGGGGGGGGGGLQDYLAQRLETLIEGLRTEAEIVAEWYAEQQQTLEDALAAKMLTEQEYMEYRERLEQEHQDRLSKIREMANSANLSMVLGAGEEILNAIGQTNKKALKVAKVFGAAQALISAYQGAAEALKLPFPKNLAAAATVLAKGISFVSAIRGVNESGAGGGGRGGGAGGASAPQQQNVQTLNFTVQNDPFGFGANIVRQIAAQLNENARNGGTIRATVAS